MRGLGFVLIGCLCLGAPALRAQDAGCGTFKWSVTRERTAFAAPDLPPLMSGGTLPAGAARLALLPQAGVAFASPPARKPKAEPAFAAVLTLPSKAAGTYEVTLSAEAWVDMLQNGKDVRSSGFSGQPDCPGVRKSVKFSLAAGPATLQVSGASVETIDIAVLPAE